MRYSTSEVRLVRTHFGISQAEMAYCLGIGRTLLAHVEAGRRSLPVNATWRLLALLRLLPPPHGSAPAVALPPDPAEATPATQKALEWRLRLCRHEAFMLGYTLERELPRLLAARHRRALPTLLATLPPPPGAPANVSMPSLPWAELLSQQAGADLARFGQQARALLEARRAGLLAEAAHLEGVLGTAPPPPVAG